MKYLILKTEDFEYLKAFYPSIYMVMIELGNNIEREIGIDLSGNVIHKYPGDHKHGRFGLNDQILGFESLFEVEIEKTDFNSIWDADTCKNWEFRQKDKG